ncbi:FAD-dependent oxidoreductase [Edaphovirga cremea]|uniref:FAD-dependent oxidoreductase n=1 Tax=Edaphovirga cremea TaxID=2267246 RepID=UPI0039892EC6
MSDDTFDTIIVGAGIAGSVAAYILAKAGADVLVIERGNYAGSKNMTGGRLYAHSLEKIMPGFAREAPVERLITREKISFMTAEDSVTLDYHAKEKNNPTEESYSVLRAQFDPWLMGKAEEVGAQFITGIRVDDLWVEDGKVVGVKAGGDELRSNTVILADGCNSILGEKLGMVKPISAESVGVGVKELIKLPQDQIEARFNIRGNEGVAWLFAGMPSNGLMGGGFLYTNQSTLSLGIVCGLHDIEFSTKSVPQMLEDFKNHPTIKPLIEGGEVIEYSAHLVPEAGLKMMPKLCRDGVVIVGDAAGFCLNMGFTIRGMDLAVASAEAAAQAVLQAREKNDYSQASLSVYEKLLEESFLMQDLKLYNKLPNLLGTSRIYNEYPQMVSGIVSDLFTVNGRPGIPLRRNIMKHCKKVGYINLIKDAVKGGRAI